MASTSFVSGTTITSAWLNDANSLVYSVFNAKLTAGAAGTFLYSNGTNIVNSAYTLPTAISATGTFLRSNGTNLVASTATFADTYNISTILYASAANTVSGLATANGGVLNTNATGVPAITSTPVLGVAGTTVGTLGFQNATSGTITLSPPAGALGTVTVTLPAATDTLVGKATTDTLTNKTLTSPTLTTPVLGIPTSGTLTNCTGLPLTTGVTGTLPIANGGTNTATGYASLASGSATTYLGADVALNNTASWFNGPNTGSIGANGQTWLIMGTACILDTSGTARCEVRLWNGSTANGETGGVTPGASFEMTVTIHAVVTLTGATTFTLQARDSSSTSGVLKTSITNASALNVSTFITAVRLA